MRTMKYEIRTFGDPVLREKAKPIDRIDDRIKDLARDMFAVMRESEGCGLAAQQIGKTISICVVEVLPEYDVDQQGARLNPDLSMPMVLINPEIISSSDKTEPREEGCLSFPGIRGSITRPYEIQVKFLDEKGVSRQETVKGFVARAIQHEIDHLNGVLFIDRMSAVKRMALAGRLKRMKSDTLDKLGI